MPDISSENVWIALAVTLAAGLATALGSLMVLFSRRPNPRLLAFGLAFAGGAMVFVSLTPGEAFDIEAYLVEGRE